MKKRGKYKDLVEGSIIYMLGGMWKVTDLRTKEGQPRGSLVHFTIHAYDNIDHAARKYDLAAFSGNVNDKIMMEVN